MSRLAAFADWRESSKQSDAVTLNRDYNLDWRLDAATATCEGACLDTLGGRSGDRESANANAKTEESESVRRRQEKISGIKGRRAGRAQKCNRGS